LILTGESYAGKYLPLFTKTILEHNKVSEDKISLKSTFIIDPYPSPVIQRTNMHVLPHAAGFIDDNNLE
jgi:carboxypeptidase C (cathepsin A)